jgi:hypothetical protein
MVRGATLDLGNRNFRVNLIIMPGLVLDIIIGDELDERLESSHRYGESSTYP